MALRQGHGAGRGTPRIETLPFDELPVGLPAPAHVENPSDRGDRGQFAAGNSLASKGGKAKRGKTRLSVKLGLRDLPDSADFAPYKSAALTFQRAHIAEVTTHVGGGVCGTGPSSMIASAALALAWSRYLSDLAADTNDAAMAAKSIELAEKSSALLAKAHEYAAKEAKARPKAKFDPLAKWMPKRNDS